MTTLLVRDRLREFFFMRQAIAKADEIASAKGKIGVAKSRAARSLLAAAESLEDVSEWQVAAVVLLRQAALLAAEALASRQKLDVDFADPVAVWSKVAEVPAVAATIQSLSTETREEVSRLVATGLSAGQCEWSPSELRALKEALFRIVHRIVPLLEAEIFAPKRLRTRVAIRWLVAVVAFALLVGLIVHQVQGMRGRINLARGASVTVDSIFRPDVYNPQGLVDGDTTQLGCHTEGSNSPWAMVDLTQTATVRRVVVTNRLDGNLSLLAVPLVIETSLDGKTFKQFARRDSDFKTWTAQGSAIQARYVRLRIARPGTLHLNEVEVY